MTPPTYCPPVTHASPGYNEIRILRKIVTSHDADWIGKLVVKALRKDPELPVVVALVENLCEEDEDDA